MVFIVLILLCLFWHGIAYLFEKRSVYSLSYETAMQFSLIFAFIVFIISTVATSVVLTEQIYSKNELKAQDAKISIYQEKTNNLVKTFVDILATQYPEHEMKVFESMTPEDAQIFLVKYPEIRASVTSIELAQKISQLNEELYDMKIERQNTIRDMLFRASNPFIYTFIIPKYKELIE